MLSLYIVNFGFGITQFWFVMDVRDVPSAASDLRLHKSQIYCGTKPLATLYIMLALHRITLCSNESSFNIYFALSKLSYSLLDQLANLHSDTLRDLAPHP